MSTNALSNSLFAAGASQPTAAQLTIVNQGQAQPQTTSTVSATNSDSAALSATAQATLLHQQGLTVQEIASNLDLTTAEVDSYLGITTTPNSGGGGGGGAVGGPHTASHAATTGTTSSRTVQTTGDSTQAGNSKVKSAAG